MEYMTEVSSQESYYKPASGSKYQFRKWFSLFLCSLSYIFVFFHRYETAVLASQLSHDLGVPKDSLGVLSAMYFWSYGLAQPFVGSLSDMIEPGYMIGTANFVLGMGTLICSLSNSLTLSCIGRFFVGLGCANIFVPTNKIGANWFSESQFRYFSGALMGLGGIGSILSQKPLVLLGEKMTWRAILLSTAIVAFILGILSFIFVKGHPNTLGFYSEVPNPPPPSFKYTIINLFKNLKKISVIGDFWILEFYMFLCPGVFNVVTALWGVPYLEDVFGYPPSQSSLIQMFLSIAIIVASPIFPIIGEKVHSRKWTMFWGIFLALIVSIYIICRGRRMCTAELIILYFLFASGSHAPQGISYSIFKELSTPDLTATLVGCGNTGGFLGGALWQQISSLIISSYGHHRHYSLTAYNVGLWGLCTICCATALVFIVLVREPKAKPKNNNILELDQ